MNTGSVSLAFSYSDIRICLQNSEPNLQLYILTGVFSSPYLQGIRITGSGEGSCAAIAAYINRSPRLNSSFRWSIGILTDPSMLVARRRRGWRRGPMV